MSTIVPREVFFTKQGCRVVLERHGDGIGISIHEKDKDAPKLYVCDAQDAREFSSLLAKIAKDEG